MSFENSTLDDLGRPVYKIVRRVGYTEEWWFKYDDMNNQIVASKRNQLIDPFITVSMGKLLEKMFRESFVLELAWEDKIEYKIDNEIRENKFKKISFYKLLRKYISKKIRTFLK